MDGGNLAGNPDHWMYLYNEVIGRIAGYQTAIAALEAKLAKATECLQWYADPEHWTIEWVYGSHGDYGTRAIATLKELAD